jgi:2-C-methyl-D-erythritol 2,4-cyclodiphosphate synthase
MKKAGDRRRRIGHGKNKAGQKSFPVPHPPSPISAFRIGHGFDVHRLEPGEGVVLGGVRIACPYRLIAHSDGDVPIHALCDALLGAAGLGDIGRHFPDSDARYRNADSRGLLREVRRLLAAAGWQAVNADLTLIAEVPRIAPHVESMRQNLGADLGLEIDAVNVKATTSEGLGFVGRKEGVAAQAVVLIGRGR